MSLSLVSLSQSVKSERSKYQDVLKFIKTEIQKRYFDENFKGIDLEEKTNLAIDLIKKANSSMEMMMIVANFLIEFDDSHLFYIPPIRVSDTDFGWEMLMVGDKCFVTEVSPDSDAEKQGLKPGDEVFVIEGFAPTRENLWKINYFYRTLIPHPELNTIIIKPDGRKIQYILKARITKGKSVFGATTGDWRLFDWRLQKLESQIDKHKVYREIKGLVIWKMPLFDISPDKVDDIFGKLKEEDFLIIDLRDNGGGRIDTALRLIGNIFDQDVIVGSRKSRKDKKDEIAESRGKKSFKGKIAVLIDNGSASASEVVAKVIQLEKRGVVFGDISAGMVMQSQISTYKDSINLYSIYGLSITVADLIMKDGKSLEKIGVIPDEQILPSALDLLNKRDPALARAAQTLGFELTPEEAGKVFAKDR
jgi:C-terminal processing protease CtpA/Prc